MILLLKKVVPFSPTDHSVPPTESSDEIYVADGGKTNEEYAPTIETSQTKQLLYWRYKASYYYYRT